MTKLSATETKNYIKRVNGSSDPLTKYSKGYISAIQNRLYKGDYSYWVYSRVVMGLAA
jgi:hypothetical protein